LRAAWRSAPTAAAPLTSGLARWRDTLHGLREIGGEPVDRIGRGIPRTHEAAAAGTKYLEFPYDPPQWVPAVRDYPLVEPIAVDEEGWLDLGEEPGLGIQLDEARLKATEI